MPEYYLYHLKGPYEEIVKTQKIEAESNAEAIKIADEKRQLYAMELKKNGATIMRWESRYSNR